MGINQDRICFFLPLWEGFQDKVIFVVDSSIVNQLGVRSGEGASSTNVILRVSPQIPAHLRHWYFKKRRRRRNTSHQFRDVSMSSECQKKSSQNKIREGFFLLRNKPKKYINKKSSPLKTQRSWKLLKKSWSRTPGSGGRPPGFNTRTPTVYAWSRVDLVGPRAHRCNWGSPHKWPKLNG